MSFSHDSTIGGLCTQIIEKFDELLKTNYSFVYKTSSIEKKLLGLQQLIHKYRVGILVIDEIEFLVDRSIDSKKLLNFLVHLNNVAGLPIVTIGNFEAYDRLFVDFKQTKRVVGEKFIQIPSLTYGDFEKFANRIWPYQWTNVETILTQELLLEFYFQSGGIPGLAKRLYCAVQDEVIGKSNEKITKSLLKKVKKDRFLPLIPFTNAILSDDENIYNLYPDIKIQKQLQFGYQITNRNSIMERETNTKQKRLIKNIEKQVKERLDLLGIDESLYNNMDFNSLIYMYLDDDPDKIKDCVLSKILKLIDSNAENDKMSKQEVDKKLLELNGCILHEI